MEVTIVGKENFKAKDGREFFKIYFLCHDYYGSVEGRKAMEAFLPHELYRKVDEFDVDYDLLFDYKGRIDQLYSKGGEE